MTAQGITCLLFAPDADCASSPISFTDEVGLETLISSGVKYHEEPLSRHNDIHFAAGYCMSTYDTDTQGILYRSAGYCTSADDTGTQKILCRSGTLYIDEHTRLIYLDSQKDMDIIEELIALDTISGI